MEENEKQPAIPRRDFLTLSAALVCAAQSELHATETQAYDPERDPYARYVGSSRDFQRVKQDRAWSDKAYPGWRYMPWTYQWNIGYTEASGHWCESHGLNGAFLDGNGGAPDSPPGKLQWIDRFHLRFYLDHTAGKGSLHLWDGGKQKTHLTELHGTGVRTVPLNSALKKRLQETIHTNLAQVKVSPSRAAYALDDEVSWGHFVHPTMWRVTDDPDAFPTWLREVYGPERAPKGDRWISYEEIRTRLPVWRLREFDASALLDQWSFNDSYWCNFLGDLVEYANTIDPETPCGIVGGQAPNAFGGYDYARLMRKIQYIEAYNLGCSQSIIRSFNLHLAVPAVTSHFHQSVDDTVWQLWYYLAHGNRGHIGWVENWFDGQTPKPWLDAVAPQLLEIEKKIAPLLQGAEWVHDGIALYYSHPSIQLGWILDAQAHGKTWINRDGDHRLGASHLVRQAWENMLRDSGFQVQYLSYIDVIQGGIPQEIRVLILPACLCLSDAEAHAITEFCRRGGTLIADYMPGLWDQHGRGRENGGVLDALFGRPHSPAMSVADVFGGRLWSETDQDANFGWKTYTELLTNGNTCIKDGTGFHKAVRNMLTVAVNKVGAGTAVLMNLSTQWYNAYRVDGMEAARRRETFMKHVLATGVQPRVQIENATEGTFGHEFTTFRRPDGRKVLFVCANPETVGTEAGGGNTAHLKTGAVPITLKFTTPVRNVRDERVGKDLGSGDRFPLSWVRNEAVVLSYE